MPKYNNIENIPAKVFFNILKSGDLQQLKPKPNEKGLDLVFQTIYDDYFLKSDNSEGVVYLKLSNKQKILAYKYEVAKLAIEHLKNPFLDKKQREEIVSVLNKVCKIKSAADLGKIKNEIKIVEIQLKEFEEIPKEEVTFYDAIAQIGQVLGRSIDENISLSMYIGYQKLSKKISKK